MNINILVLRFSPMLSHNEIPHFRGAVLKLISSDSDILFHNHDGDEGLRYGYPLVQYKTIHTHASIVCIGEGTGLITKLASVFNRKVKLWDRDIMLDVVECNTISFDIVVGEMCCYRITDWMPFNETNEIKYRRLREDSSIYNFLSQILTSNILSFAKSLGIFIEEEIHCQILSLENYRQEKCKGVYMRVFDAEFSCNVRLPDYIGLGKHTSFGYGVIKRTE